MYLTRKPVGKRSWSKHEIHFCFINLHILHGGNYIVYFYHICVLGMTHCYDVGVEYSTHSIMLILKKFRLWSISHFRFFVAVVFGGR